MFSFSVALFAFHKKFFFPQTSHFLMLLVVVKSVTGSVAIIYFYCMEKGHGDSRTNFSCSVHQDTTVILFLIRAFSHAQVFNHQMCFLFATELSNRSCDVLE